MKKSLMFLVVAATSMSSAFAAELTPYVGLGVVIDKAGTSAKRMGFSMVNGQPAPVPDAGGDMEFDVAFAGELTAGVKYGHLRGELEVAVRSAAEDDYDLYSGMFPILQPSPSMQLADVETSTSVKHNSYMANFYYDFELSNPKWTPYVGAGIGIGTYKQTAEVEVDFENDMIPDQRLAKVVNDKTEFEWQVAAGVVYNFTDVWGLDVAYRFNSSTVGGEFVYAHELKLGARYSF